MKLIIEVENTRRGLLRRVEVNKRMTPEEAAKLKPTLDELGIKFATIYENKCKLCDKKFTSKSEKKLARRFKKHVDECPAGKWMRAAFKILKIAGLKKVILADLIYLEEGKFPEGCERTKPEELEILDDVKNMMDNWGKEEEE